MELEEEKALIAKYGEQIVLNGYEEFEKHIRDRKKSLEKLNQRKIDEDGKYAVFRKNFGGNARFDYDGLLKEHNKSEDAKEAGIAKKYSEKEKESLSKEEKKAQFIENFKDLEETKEEVQAKNEKPKDQEPDSTAKHEQIAKAIELPNEKQKLADKQQHREEQLAAFKAEIQAAVERNREKDRER